MRLFLGVALAAAGAARICSSAPIETEAIPSVSFGRYPLGVVRTHAHSSIGAPAGKAELVSPFPNDFPPCLTIGLETGKEADGGGRFLILSRNYLRIFNIREVKSAPYETIQSSITRLERFLSRRFRKPPNASRKDGDEKPSDVLPDYPPRNAGHLIEAKLSYVDAPWGSGMFYITQLFQGNGEAPNNQQLVYLFQGISKTKKLFVSADFQISHPEVPARPEDTPDDEKEADALCEKIERKLNAASDESFTPSLRAIREWVAGLQMK